MVAPKHQAGGAQLTYLMIGGGPGSFIGAVHKSALDFLAQARLVGGAFSRDYAKSKAQGETWGLDPGRVYQDFGKMLDAEAAREDKPDFVVIVTPNAAHFPAAKMALEKGFNVACDKPLTMTVAEADELAALTKKQGLEFLVTYTYLGYPMVRQMREMVKRGDLGAIRLVAAEYLQDWLNDLAESGDNKQASWRTDPAQSGVAGCMGDIGSHAESLVTYITGLEMEKMSSNINTFVQGRKLDDNGFVWFTMPGGAKGSIWASQVAIGKENGLNIRIFGEKGGLEWHQETPNALYFFKKGEPVQILTRAQGYNHPHAARFTRIPTGHPEGYFEAFANLYDAFIQNILARAAGRKPGEYDIYPTVDFGVRGVKFVHTAIESSKKGGAWIDVIK